MSKFADQLLADLMREYRPALQDMQPRAAARRPARRRPIWLTVGATAMAGAIAASVAGISGFGGATPAFAVTENSKGVVTVKFNGQHHYALLGPYYYPLTDIDAELAGINAQLRALHTQAVLVPVRPGCPSPSSLTVHSPKGTGQRILAHNNRDGFTFSTLRRLPEDEVLIIYVVRRAGGVQLALANGSILFPGTGATVVKAPAPQCVSL